MALEPNRKIFQLFPSICPSEAFARTETTACGAMAKHKDFLAKQGTVGRPLVLIEAWIVDDDDNDVPAGEVGEIVHCGPTVSAMESMPSTSSNSKTARTRGRNRGSISREYWRAFWRFSSGSTPLAR